MNTLPRPDATRESPPTFRSLIDHRWLVIGVLFLVTGALGIPLLWMNRRFKTVTKIWLSVVVFFYTAWLIWLTWLVLVWSYTRIIESL